MPTRKKSRTRSARSKKSKFITPELVLCAGQLIRFVANDDNPLSQAERLRSDYAELEDGDQESLHQFLQRVYYVAVQFRRFPREFERLQAHQFWKDSGQEQKDASTSRWLMSFILRATPTNVPHLADQYAAILDSFMRNEGGLRPCRRAHRADGRRRCRLRGCATAQARSCQQES